MTARSVVPLSRDDRGQNTNNALQNAVPLLDYGVA
jgi:hypothetical protein